MLDEVIDALDVMVDRMGRAIDFSRGFANCNEVSMAAEEAFDFHDKAIADHAAWYADYFAAVETLERVGFRSRYGISWGNLKIPQVAFSEVPIISTLGVDLAKHVWVIGSGECYWTDKQQPANAEKLHAGELLVYQPCNDEGGEHEVREISNLFDSSLVEWWVTAREEFAEIAQRMRDIRFAIAVSGGQAASAIGPRVGRPPSDEVAERRRQVLELTEKGFTQGQIVESLRSKYPRIHKDIVKDDRRVGKKGGKT